jgi:hypothetical protein
LDSTGSVTGHHDSETDHFRAMLNEVNEITTNQDEHSDSTFSVTDPKLVTAQLRAPVNEITANQVYIFEPVEQPQLH